MISENQYKVCILTAGKGSRLAPITDHLNKALLPLGEKATISHIIDKFPYDTEFVIATGFNASGVKQYLKLAHPNGRFVFVDVLNFDDVGSGPGHSLLCCEEHLDCPFIFFSCDTIVTDKIPNCVSDWIGISETNNPKVYCTALIKGDHVSSLLDKSSMGTSHAFIGLAGIYNHKLFFQGLRESSKLTEGEIQITSGLEALVQNGELNAINFEWFDTGNWSGYKKPEIFSLKKNSILVNPMNIYL